LKLLARDRHPRNQTLIARFARCTDYQDATRLLIQALGSTGRWQKGSPCATARLASTADLMATGDQLSIPRLEGIPLKYESVANRLRGALSGLIGFLRALYLCGFQQLQQGQKRFKNAFAILAYQRPLPPIIEPF
jgi:hypothetical protein